MGVWQGFLHLIQQGLVAFAGLAGGNYVVGVVLLTVAVRVILLPLGVVQVRSMQKMAQLAPKQRELQAKYKGDSRRMQEELAKLYKEAEVNPMAGCLPLLLQLPVMYGLFDVLRSFPYHVGHGVLWMQDLAKPDPTYLLPLLVAVSTFFIQKQTMQMTPTQPGMESSQKMMLYVMPLVFGYVAARFPAGLSIYYVMSNIFQMGQNLILLRQPVSGPRGGKAAAH